MLALRTFGAVYVSGADGVPKGGPAAQKRLLALLAILSTAGDSGVSRDRLLALLWPESEPERARHALTQTLYHARRALECDDLFVIAGGDIRINRQRLNADVDIFETRLRAGDYAGAMAVYAGEFLDGFFVSGVAEFEQWTSAQRIRLNEAAARACDQLGAAAEAAGDWTHAIEWRKRLLALGPLSALSTTKLMTAMAAAGDRAGALNQARVHAALIRAQLDLDPDPIVTQLAEQLRNAPVEPPRDRVVAMQQVAAMPALVDATTSGAPTLPPARRSRRGLRVAAFATFSTLALVAAFSAGLREKKPAETDPQQVFVAPFRVSGAEPTLSYLKEGMVELLSARLADDHLAHAVDPGAALAAWRRSKLTNDEDVARPTALAVAQTLGATRVVVGSVVGGPSRLVLSASLIANPSGDVRAQATVEGPADSITVLVDRLAAKLLAANAGEAERLVAHAPPPLESLRAFLAGQAAYRRGDYAEAIPAFERALEIDSTFALAALQLALASDRINDAEQHSRALSLAWAYRHTLSARDLAHLIAFAGPRFPAPSTEAEQLAAWQHAIALAPDRADVWYELGERYFRTGAVVGTSNALQLAASALRRALDLDPTHTRAHRLLVQLAARNRDTALLRRIASPSALRDSLGELAPFLQWRVALVRDDAAELRRVRARLPHWGGESLRALAMASLNDAVAVEDGERAVRLSLAQAVRAPDQWDALLALHALALNMGRPLTALEATDEIASRFPASRAHLRLRVLDAIYSEGDSLEAAIAAESLAVALNARRSGAEARATDLADLCVLTQWQLANGITRETKRAIAQFRASEPQATSVPVAAPPLVCAMMLEATYAVATHARDALSRVAALDSLILSGPAVSDAGTYAHILLGRLYRKLGQPKLALDAYRRRTYMTGWPRYLATARREEGAIAESIGEHAIAAASYSRYLALRRQPEPKVARQVDEIRQSLSGLESSSVHY